MAVQKYSLTWRNFQNNLIKSFNELYNADKLCDVTICCENFQIGAHKIILSASSTFFQTAFEKNPCQHPIVILKDVEKEDLQALLRFIYEGEVDVPENQLASLIKTAELLQIKGLADKNEVKTDVGNSKRQFECDGKSSIIHSKKSKGDNLPESEVLSSSSNMEDFQSVSTIEYDCGEIEMPTKDEKPIIDYDYNQFKDETDILYIAPSGTEPIEFSSPSTPCLRIADPVPCPHCNKFMKNEPCLRKHIRFIHSGPCVCQSCGKWFKNKGLFVEHSRLVCTSEGKRKSMLPS